MGQAKRRKPDPMPKPAAAATASKKLTVPMIVTGSRGTRRLADADFDIHSVYHVAAAEPNAALDTVADKHTIIHVHGYNVTARQSLDTAADFFAKTQTALTDDGQNPADYAYVAFTWPGDVGPLWFGDAQEFAQFSGVALYELVRALVEKHGAKRVTLVTHSLGAHVGLRSAAILGERLYSGKGNTRYHNALLLAPAVEDDVFERPKLLDEFHFPDAPFGIGKLHIFASRADGILKNAFFASALDKALGYAGPQSMKPLQSMARRVGEVLGEPHRFEFQLHDLSPNSTTIINPALHAHDHGDYWARQNQTDYYINHLA